MDLPTLASLVQTKCLIDADLSGLDLSNYDFSNCELRNVRFAAEGASQRELRGLVFRNAKLENVSFDRMDLIGCDFDGASTKIVQTSFRESSIKKCRFRRARFEWCDFRYAEIDYATFENAAFAFCDFYRAFFVGIAVFRKARIENCSLFYTFFGDSTTLKRENLVGDRLLQEDPDAYRQFLCDWQSRGTGVRLNDRSKQSDWSPDASLRARFADAEDIYKTLNGLWTSKGFLGDASWAFVKGKRMERRRLWGEICSADLSGMERAIRTRSWLWNLCTGYLFGYGESIGRMVLTYTTTVFLFAYFYYANPDIHLPDYTKAVGVSLKNMVAMSPEEVSRVSPVVDFLNMVQTTAGILMTGIFGFILGNRIRNQ